MTQPCFVPLETENESDTAPLSEKRAITPSWNERIMFTTLGGYLTFRRIFHCTLQLIELKALVRSINTMNKSRFCSLHFSCVCRAANIISVVPLPALNLHWLSGKILSMWGAKQLTITPANTLPATLSRDIPRWLLQIRLSPLFLHVTFHGKTYTNGFP